LFGGGVGGGMVKSLKSGKVHFWSCIQCASVKILRLIFI